MNMYANKNKKLTDISFSEYESLNNNVFWMSYLNIDQLIIFQDSYKPAVKQLEKWP